MNTTNNYCSIYLNRVSFTTEKKLECSHIFHRSCLINWLEESNTCPECRNIIVVKKRS